MGCRESGLRRMGGNTNGDVLEGSYPGWGVGIHEGRVQGAGYRVQGAGYRVQGAGCRVQKSDQRTAFSVQKTVSGGQGPGGISVSAGECSLVITRVIPSATACCLVGRRSCQGRGSGGGWRSMLRMRCGVSDLRRRRSSRMEEAARRRASVFSWPSAPAR